MILVDLWAIMSTCRIEQGSQIYYEITPKDGTEPMSGIILHKKQWWLLLTPFSCLQVDEIASLTSFSLFHHSNIANQIFCIFAPVFCPRFGFRLRLHHLYLIVIVNILLLSWIRQNSPKLISCASSAITWFLGFEWSGVSLRILVDTALFADHSSLYMHSF